MELFMIERYVGESSLPVDNTSDQESQRLAELLQQAKGRKRSRETSLTSETEKHPCSDDAAVLDSKTSPKAKRNKKKKDGKVKKERKLKHPTNEDETSGSPRGHFIHRDDDESEKTSNAVNKIESKDTNTVKSPLETLSDSEKCIKEEKQSKPEDEMTVIGGQTRKQRPNSVRRILPRWLANPYFFSEDVKQDLLPVSALSCLDQDFVRKLDKQEIQHFFPVQQVIIPEVLLCWEEQSPLGKGGYLPPDLCVCAPTGSGKTLAYVLPIVQLLLPSAIRRLEALVIVPTKDLATQVWGIFNIYVQGTGLKVGLANGLKGLQKEQEKLGRKSSIGYSSHVNILVATPGRLVEHISSTAGFTLKFLRFFVIDEADRLLAEPYFGWLNKVYTSVYSSSSTTNKEEYRAALSCGRFPPHLLTPFWSEAIQRPLQKLLFSATLTQNPEKLAPLQLYRPKFFTASKTTTVEEGMEDAKKTAGEGFISVSQTPATLQESMYICNSGGKPLVLLYLLTELGFDRVLCFTSSVQSTHRLYLLVKHFGGIGATEFSSSLTAVQRQGILHNFNTGKTQLIICSDAMARGLDLPGVQYVVSYDPPVSSKTYIHRVGRTARAGRTGTAITFLHDNEVFHFKKMLKSLDKCKIPKHSVKDNALEPLMERYEEALEKLKTEVISDKKQPKRTPNKSRNSAQ